jgi:hypothetical protein
MKVTQSRIDDQGKPAQQPVLAQVKLVVRVVVAFEKNGKAEGLG